jgi:hypothetical protein
MEEPAEAGLYARGPLPRWAGPHRSADLQSALGERQPEVNVLEPDRSPGYHANAQSQSQIHLRHGLWRASPALRPQRAFAVCGFIVEFTAGSKKCD